MFYMATYSTYSSFMKCVLMSECLLYVTKCCMFHPCITVKYCVNRNVCKIIFTILIFLLFLFQKKKLEEVKWDTHTLKIIT